jgi:hypothetical protein
MLHSGVFVGRQYAAFAGITHGQKVHDFIEELVARKFVTPIELGSTGRTKIFHVHHKPLYAAMGEPDNRNRRRFTIDRAIERLMVLDGVLADRSVTWLGSEREKRRYFKQRLGDSFRDDEYPRLVFGKTPNVTVRTFQTSSLSATSRIADATSSSTLRAIHRRWISVCSSCGNSSCSTRWASGPFEYSFHGPSSRRWMRTRTPPANFLPDR